MEIKLDYVKVGDYYLPDLVAEQRPNRGFGKFQDLFVVSLTD